MSDPAITRSLRPRPPAPLPRKTIPGAIEFFRVLRGSAIEGLAVDHYEKPIVVTKTALGPVIVASSPSALRHVLVANAKNYPRDALQRRMISDGIGFGLLAAEGEQWRRQRRAMAPAFTPEKVAAFEQTVAAAAADLVGRWAAQPDGATVYLDELQHLAVDVLEDTLFPDGIGDKTNIPAALKSYFRIANKVSVLDALRLPERVPRIAALRARRFVTTLRRAAEQTVAHWQTRPPQAPRASLLDTIGAGSAGLGPVEVRDNVVTLATAGSETTAGVLCWVLYLLSIDAEWRQRVEEEADRAMPDGVYVPGCQKHLPATRAVVDETLRLYPTVAVTARKALAADTIDGVAVTPGTIVVISPWVIQRHRTLWQDPDLFDPARFLPGARETIDRFAYLPFGVGARVCIGQGFAIQELVITVASIVRRLRLTPAPGFSIWPDLKVTLQPTGNLAMTVQARG